MPQFLWSPRKEGAAARPPSLLGKGRRESVEYAGRCWAGRCCHEACLPPTLRIRSLAAFSWGLSPSTLARMVRLTPALSSRQQQRRQGSDQSRPTSQVSGQPQAGGRFRQSFNPTEGSKSDQFQKNKESLTPQAPFFLKRSQTPGSGLLREAGSPLNGLCLYPGDMLAFGPPWRQAGQLPLPREGS